MKRLTITEQDEFDICNIEGSIGGAISFLEEMISNGYHSINIENYEYESKLVFERNRPETDKEFEARKKQKAKDKLQNQFNKKVKELKKQVEAEYK